MSTLNLAATGISPAFPVSAEELVLHLAQVVTPTNVNGVQPPVLGVQGGYSLTHNRRNRWFPWIDEKLVAPKYDGVAAYLGMPSNRPTPIKDYHMLSLMRAVDYILAIAYRGIIEAEVDTVLPQSPPAPAGK